ncbi:unnamed protein product [Candidula unifasciata]|uniref:Salivary lipocalin n=1 Tax=Candidula unifasciata TaxID=100452 RepID=A0A8S3ZXV2_9EUPU|nr:unnamed protein product [Candidula unifasciata]
MNLFQISVALGAVLAVRSQDPTTVCFPPVYQAAYLNLINEDKGTIYVDFKKELWVEVSAVTGVRTVSDFANLKTHVITGQGNHTSCKSFQLRQSQIMHPCLPQHLTSPRSTTPSTGSSFLMNVKHVATPKPRVPSVVDVSNI